MAEMLTIAQLAKNYEESEWTIRRTLLALIASGVLAENRDYHIEQGNDKFHRTYFVDRKRFLDEATKLRSRLASKLLALNEQHASEVLAPPAEPASGARTSASPVAEIELRFVKEALDETKQERNALAEKAAALRGEAGRWKGAYEVERETRVRSERERREATNHLIGATAEVQAGRREIAQLQSRLRLLTTGKLADAVESTEGPLAERETSSVEGGAVGEQAKPSTA